MLKIMAWLIVGLTTKLALGSITIIAPPNAMVGQPILISVEGGLPSSCLWRSNPKEQGDILLQLFDANGKPVIIYWSLVPGLKEIECITGECDTSDKHVVTLDFATATIELVTGPLPDPDPQPTPDYKAKVAPLVAFVSGVKINPEDAASISDFYTDFASVVSRSSLKNTQQFREAYIEAGKLSVAHLRGKYTGLGATIDKILINELGTDIKALDKVETSLILRAIGWAVLQ